MGWEASGSVLLQLQDQSFQRVFRIDILRINWFDLLDVQETLKSLAQQFKGVDSSSPCDVVILPQ